MVIISDSQNRTDSAYHTLVKHIECKIPIVMVSWVEGFVFNDALLDIKEAVLIDYCEYGWNFEITDTHIWGKNKDASGRYIGEEWDKFDEWAKGAIKLLFKRELLKKDVSDFVKPIEYPCISEVYSVQTRDQFNLRPINVFQYWGRSNECRLRIHGEIWLHGFNKGFQVCDNVYYVKDYLAQESGEKWITLWIPHWARIDMKNILEINSFSKLSLSWPGAGFKCFRTMECPVNSILVMHKNDFAWTYEFDETNCILVEPGKEIEGIGEALNREDLYDVYLGGMQTVDKYRTANYLKSYIEPIINNL